MREWKNRHGRKCRGGKGGIGNIGTILQGWKMREWKHRERSLLQNVLLGSAEKRMVKLISREIIFEDQSYYVSVCIVIMELSDVGYGILLSCPIAQ